MSMPNPSPSSEKSLEEALSQCVEELRRKKLTTSCPATVPAGVFLRVESPNRGNESCLRLHHERGFKCNAPRVSNEKLGPQRGAIGKLRQQRQTSKGTIKMYSADPSSFRALVYEHTSKLPHSPPPDVAAQPSSPLTPHSITSTSSTRGFMSQPSSPATPHSIQSSSTSPLSSPHQGPAPNLNAFYLPFKAHADVCRPRLNVPYHLPLLCNANQNGIPDHNTNIHQSTSVTQSASMPCLGISSAANNVPSNGGRPHGMSPAMYARALSLRRFLLDDDAVCDGNYT